MTRGRLEARGVVLRRGGVLAVDHVDLVAEPARITAVIGPNGAGKTTLFDGLSGMRRVTAGWIVLDGKDLTTLAADERSRAGMARTFQRSAVFTSLTVAENLWVGTENRRRQGVAPSILGLPERGRAKAGEIVESALDELGLGSIRNVQAGRLPTGTLRLVELGRAVCTDPAVLLLDEPASGLDDSEVNHLRQVVKSLARRGPSVVLVEHDIDLVEDLADVVYAMAGGRMIASGPPAEVVARSDVQALVLGMAE